MDSNITEKDVQVFCDLHNLPMERIIYRFEVRPGDGWDQPFLHCTHAGCRRHFSPGHGYVNVAGRIVGESRSIKFCENNLKHFGSVAIVGFDGDKPIWQCIFTGCKPQPQSPYIIGGYRAG